jgi:signal transduction histidine kinase
VVVLGEDGGWASAKTALEPVDLGAAVLALEAPVRIAVGPDVSVQLDVEPGASVALVGPGDPERLILPLVDNAARALANAGTLRIAVGRGPWAAAEDTDATPDWALVVVADTGPGIPGEVLAELRESLSPIPSPVLDDAESPSSLVAINRLVSDLGGHLDISSVAGHGTTVTIALPLHDATSPPIVVLDGPYESVSFG